MQRKNVSSITPSIIQQTILKQSWNTLCEMLVDPNEIYDIAEIRQLIFSKNLDSTVKNSAFFYLIGCDELINLQIIHKTDQINLGYNDKKGRNALLHAVRHGREDVLKWLIEKGQPLNAIDGFNAGPVLFAVRYGQISLLKKLLQPVTEGGFGLSLEIKDRVGANPVLYAALGGQVEMFKYLVSPQSEDGLALCSKANDKNNRNAIEYAAYGGNVAMVKQLLLPLLEGGYGFDWTHEAMNCAAKGANLPVLEWLILPKKEGGQGISLSEDLECSLKNSNESTYTWFVINTFNQMLPISCIYALDWLKDFKDKHNKEVSEKIKLKQSLINRCQEIFEFYLNLPDASETKELPLIIDVMEELEPGIGRMTLADTYLAISDFVSASQNYLSIFEDNECSAEKKQKAGLELADIIFNGHITLKEGIIEINEPNEIKLKKETTLRVIHAYEYLYNNNITAAKQLRQRFDSILSENFSPSSNHANAVWTISSIFLFKKYYAKKNPSILNDPIINKQLEISWTKPKEKNIQPPKLSSSQNILFTKFTSCEDRNNNPSKKHHLSRSQSK